MIVVLAGVNGAGKSSIAGSALRAKGQNWYNPDELARAMHEQYPDGSPDEIDGIVWHEGLSRLNTAILDDANFAFETTLGGNTITNTLLDAIAAGVKINVWYCGLESPELHIERVAARVARGGHAIPETRIRARFETSMRNLCRLTPGLHQLAVHDNSAPLNKDGRPDIRRLLHVARREIRQLDPDMPAWAKPVAVVCLNHFPWNSHDPRS